QAEDGIRDFHVTGVQTCALPIYNLKIFNYPSIQYEVDKRDTTAQSLIAKVYLTPRKKYSFGATFDVTHSNIQDFGIGASISETKIGRASCRGRRMRHVA